MARDRWPTTDVQDLPGLRLRRRRVAAPIPYAVALCKNGARRTITLGERTPAELLRNVEGVRALEMEIERIWGESSEWIQIQDAFLLRARDAVERATSGVGGISPRELLKRMDDRIETALLRTDLRSKEA